MTGATLLTVGGPGAKTARMTGSRLIIGFAILAIPVAIAPAILASGAAVMDGRPRATLEGTTLAEGVPVLAVDPRWPQPLPGSWILGQVSGIAVDGRDNVWIVHRPRTLSASDLGAEQVPPVAQCCTAAPAVLALDPEGSVVRSWGGPGAGYEWPESEHSIHVDAAGNVWITSNGRDDHQVLKFAADGTFLLQIGRRGRTGGSNDTLYLGQPAGLDTDLRTNEVYIADGYRNRRIIVFDASTGRYKRHWGAYGSRPADTDDAAYDPAALPRQFGTPVHGVRLSRDGLVYVADRSNDRIQVFRPDGEFVQEATIAPATRALGSVWDVAFSHDSAQRYLYVADGTNRKVWIVSRADLRVVGEFGRGGQNAGQFGWVHDLAVDSRGNVYTAEVDIYRRVQKFEYGGLPTPDE